jgi:mannose-6-phosphate isomerase-like protein (cupin superfamily)
MAMTTQNVMTPVATLVDPAAMEALPWHPLEGFSGVTYKLLWRSGKSVAGIMRIEPGSELTTHEHQRSHHHMWVLDGEAEALGRPIGTGTYLHIPAGVEHGISGVGPAGCTLLYLYLRDERPPSPEAGGPPTATGGTA